jgi:maltose alpha-D-glucosyltransferase / alpha-amylase
MYDLWYKDAIIYCLDVDSFQDANGDGIGDFQGLTERLAYLEGLGVNCLWLLPFYPSPDRDNGYDIIDYYSVDSRLGTLGDFTEFMHQAHKRGMRIIIDLVVNHTSNRHPWFQAARADSMSLYHDYYVWSDTKPAAAADGVVFPGVQESVWSYDRKARAYYFHRFYKHQPDLNIANPAVREEIRKIMGFWLALGVAGFRIDAAPFLIELRGIENVEVTDPYQYLREFRDFLSWRRGDAILLAEANVAMEKIPDYFGDGNKLHMLFNFMANQHLFLALAREQALPLIEGFYKLPSIPKAGQWANFLRNHDELDLGRLSETQREQVFQAFGPEETMQLYHRGIRRRLAPMLNGDLRRLELAYSLLFTLTGTPVLWYGEEIGMGEDLSLNERNSVRTPMQWSEAINGGFSTASPEQLIRPVINEGPFQYQNVNVAAQRRDPNLLLNWIERAIRLRKECSELGWGDWRILETDDPAVFAHSCQWQNRTILAVHNLSSKAREIKLDLRDYKNQHILDLLGDRKATPIQDDSHHVELEGYGYRWLRLIP